MKYVSILLLLAFITINTVEAQLVWENHRSEVYPYLMRLAQKGLLEMDDLARPLSRQQIFQYLDTLQQKKEKLSKTEKTELNFYLQEYRPLVSEHLQFGQKDSNGRLRFLSIRSKDFEIHVDPIISAGYVTGNTTSFRQISNGVQLWGKAGKFGFNLYYRDITETGTGLDTFRKESPETGIIRVGPIATSSSQNFSDIRGHIGYSWKKASISFGKDQYLWGYGENGRMVLSDKAPAYAYLRFDYQPIKWLHFQQIHGWLNSNIIDSNRTYGTGTSGVLDDIRLIYRSKFITNHSLNITPLKGLSIAFGESMIYSDRFDPVFMLPLMLYKVYDNARSGNNLNAGSNGQLFAQVSSRDHLKKTHLYGTLFIDEIRLSTIWDKQRRRTQIGANIGFNTTDFILAYLTLGAEYTRLNPFVYQNYIPTQRYNHYDVNLGDWIGNNADRLLAFVRYTPVPKLRTTLRLQQIRKGGQGTIWQQYFATPQPPFLFDLQKKRTDLSVQVNYEWINNLYFTGSFQYIHHKPYQRASSNETIFQLGFSYGLR